ncbi:hypothetical protein CCR83_05730 [Rhodobacter veldkampii DSM 11550]|uniref:Uncharacterized protein n=1 Tax=Phaeovulum veldkampii DSM 11550 TaxID=1185920 RepID=A0A2T4JM23_9RHOB|nr:hypothetical protein [Phaeovulum veldkampii]MBK5945964.1 hypothetical protein [Phaeovulum veldkampii DSM 11550]PTE18913.1 hypothetical protein C5F46_01750 [Phaeovulum veldkampii DSM 11550]TDQ64641.1 hypothetical protein EV658_101103 [Phaeovulum veldkampii DSM 11550]
MIIVTAVRDGFALLMVVFAAYIVAFKLSFNVFYPVQDALLPAFQGHAMLVFLPHGVKVLAAWLYGWKSLLLLLPGAATVHFLLFGSDGLSFPEVMSPLVGASCGAAAFALLRLVRLDARPGAPRRLDWKVVLAAGATSSVLNSVGTCWANGVAGASVFAYLLGDLLGTVVLMVGLMLVFRWGRQKGL